MRYNSISQEDIDDLMNEYDPKKAFGNTKFIHKLKKINREIKTYPFSRKGNGSHNLTHEI